MSATAYGWLQRVRHNTYTVRYRGLVADHHLLVDHPSPRPAHLIRTVTTNLQRNECQIEEENPTWAHVLKGLKQNRNTGEVIEQSWHAAKLTCTSVSIAVSFAR
jgi:hypothetical protein